MAVIYMLWMDASNKPLLDRLERAIQYYEEKISQPVREVMLPPTEPDIMPPNSPMSGETVVLVRSGTVIPCHMFLTHIDKEGP